MVNPSEVYFLWVDFNEVQDLLVAEPVSIVAISASMICALNSVPEPAVLNPSTNFLVVFPEGKFKVADCVAFANSPRMP